MFTIGLDSGARSLPRTWYHKQAGLSLGSDLEPYFRVRYGFAQDSGSTLVEHEVGLMIACRTGLLIQGLVELFV